MNNESLWEMNMNNSFLFLLPAFGTTTDRLVKLGIRDTYLRDTHREYDAEHLLFLLFKPLNLELLNQWIDEMDERGLVMDEYDYEEGYVVVVLRFPEKFVEDYVRVMKGKYSKCSREYKKMFPRTIKVRDGGKEINTTTLQVLVFERDKSLKKDMSESFGIPMNKLEEELGPDYECWPIVNMDKETLNIVEVIAKHNKKIKA